MKIKFISLSPYLINDKLLRFGDVIENDGNYLKSYPYLFEEVKKKVDLSSMKVSDLQKFAEQHNIEINRNWNKKQLLDNINKAINE